MITIAEAIDLVAAQVGPLPSTKIPLGEALGLVLAGDVESDIDSPPYSKAMMDGFAVVAGDPSPERRIIEEVMAGEVPHRAIQPGVVTRIMTGAPVPDGATAVVPVEKSELLDPKTVRLGWEPPKGAHIMLQGSSMQTGQQVLTAGTQLRAIEIAILAEVGCSAVPVFPKPRVAVLATGNELTPVERRPGPGQIRNSGGPLLRSAVSQAGAIPIELPVCRDEIEPLTEAIKQGLQAEVLLVAGGVSAGMKDLVPAALTQAGVQQVFHKVAMKPGKPIWFGIVQPTEGNDAKPAARPKLVFGMPGNPVSGLVGFHLFVKPALDVLAGRSPQMALPLVRGRMAESHSHRGGREMYRPARAVFSSRLKTELPRVEMTDWQGSADVAGLATANCLLHLPATPLELSAGDEVDFLPLG